MNAPENPEDQNTEEFKRLKVKRENIGREIGSDVGQKQVRRRRKRVTESRDAKFRKDGSADQDYFDPDSSRSEREEDSWVKSKRKGSKKSARKQLKWWVISGILLIGSMLAIMIIPQFNREVENEDKGLGEVILDYEEQTAKQAKVQIVDEDTAAELSKSEQIAQQLPEIRKVVLALLEKLQNAETAADIEALTRPYEGREADIKNWLADTPQSERPRSNGVFLNATVADGVACVQMMGELINYEYYVTYLVDVDGEWLIDFESFIAKSEVPIEKLAKEGTDGTVTIRAMISAGSFFTPPVINDKDYSCFLARTLDPLEYVWVYTPKGGLMDKQLQQEVTGEMFALNKANKQAPKSRSGLRAFRLKLKPFYGAVLKSQYELVEIKGHGWLDMNEEATDE